MSTTNFGMAWVHILTKWVIILMLRNVARMVLCVSWYFDSMALVMKTQMLVVVLKKTLAL